VGDASSDQIASVSHHNVVAPFTGAEPEPHAFPANTMPLHLYKLSRDRPNDSRFLSAIARIHFAAWMTLPLMQKVYYRPDSSHHLIIAKYLKQHRNSFENEPACRFVVVIDDELEEEHSEEADNRIGECPKDDSAASKPPRGRVIAAIKYYQVPGKGPHPDTGTQEVIDNPNQPVHDSWYENEALSNAFVGPMVEARKHVMTTVGDHIVIDNLYTDPAHQRRGAGGLLTRLVCQQADDLRLPMMLEGSPPGMKVYESVGFKKVDWPGAEIWLDLKRWENGGDKGQDFEDERLRSDPDRKDEWYAQIVMLRPPSPKDDSIQVPIAAGDEGAVVV
jgi:GNAT superfamily N-acetyltransferase